MFSKIPFSRKWQELSLTTFRPLQTLYCKSKNIVLEKVIKMNKMKSSRQLCEKKIVSKKKMEKISPGFSPVFSAGFALIPPQAFHVLVDLIYPLLTSLPALRSLPCGRAQLLTLCCYGYAQTKLPLLALVACAISSAIVALCIM